MKKILITGVAGFIGSHVSRRFLHEGYDVVGVDDLSNGKIKNVPEGVVFIEGDLAQLKTIKAIPKGCHQILHLAGQSSGEISFDDPVEDIEKNTISTLNLIKYGIENRSDRIVYASSMSVYGNVLDMPTCENVPCEPLSCYGVGKVAAEGYLKVYQKQLPYVSLRMFNVYGPGQDMENLRQGMVSIFLAQALKNKNILVKGGLDRFRDFIYIDDVVEAWYRAAIYRSSICRTLNLGTGIKTTVGELLDNICAQVDGSSYYVKGKTLGDQSGIYANTTEMSKVLGIDKLKSVNEGVLEFVEWAKQNTGYNRE